MDTIASQTERLHPFIGYYGGKSRLAPKYPAPVYDTIIEPFAGSAGYSLLHHLGRDVILCDANRAVARVWNLVIHGSPDTILALPDEPNEQLEQAERDLMGFWFSKAPMAPRKAMAKGWAEKYPGTTYWGEKIRNRIAREMPYVAKWQIVHGDYRSLPKREATWFIDPPYQHNGGALYPNGSRGLDYSVLADWCKALPGQVIVCEAEDARWLPFRPLARGKRSAGAKGGQGPAEVVWVKWPGDEVLNAA